MSPAPTRTTRSASILALLLAPLAVAACGGEASTSGTTSGGRGPEASAEPAPAATPASSASAAPAASASAAAPADPLASHDLNVLVVSIDSVRDDRMKWAGYERDVMPRLTKLAEESVLWTRFYATSSYTAISLGGFLGGRYPSSMKRSGYFFAAYPEEETLFPELLQKAGIETVSAQAHFYFAPEKAGFHQGFDVWELVPGLKKSNTTDENVTSPQHTEMAIRQMDAAAGKGRFFAWYHLLDPHDQYMKHAESPDFGRGAKNAYDGELFFTDLHLGKIIDHVDAQPWGKKTVIIVTSDHGEAFGDKGMHRHGFELWNVLTHVPLVIRAPGVAPRKIDVPRSMVDLAPTILDLFGVPKDPQMVGESLVPEMKGAEAEPRDVIIDLPRSSDNDRRRAFIRGNHKLIAFGDDFSFQLYDVVADPAEKKDLAKTDKELFASMKKAYDEAMKKVPEVCPKMTEKLKGRNKKKPC
jgi:arylsulfatase A-like enzyme